MPPDVSDPRSRKVRREVKERAKLLPGNALLFFISGGSVRLGFIKHHKNVFVFGGVLVCTSVLEEFCCSLMCRWF